MSYAKLRGAIREKFGTQEAFAAAMDMHPSTLSNKMRGASDWTRQEIETASKLLEFSVEEIPSYFFTY